MGTEPAEVVLIVEDEPGVAQLQRKRLERAGYRVRWAAATADARSALAAGGIDLMTLDYRLPDAPDGLEFYAELKAGGLDLPVILVTAYTDDRAVVAALRAGIRDYVTKSSEYLDYLPEAVRRVLAQERNARERRRAEEALRESEDRLTAIIEQLPVGVGLVNPDGGFVIRNSVMRNVASEVMPSRDVHCRERWRCIDARGHLVPRDQWPGARALRGEIVNPGMEIVHTDEKGNERSQLVTAVPFRDSGAKVIGAIVVASDITDRKRGEEKLQSANEQLEYALATLQAQTDELAATTQQLWQAAKLATVGELAASVAHELNNPLGTVSLRLEGVLARTPADDPRRPALEVIEQEVERMARLIANLLQFSRQAPDQVSTMDVAGEVTRTAELADHHLRRRGVTVAFDFATGLPPIHADRQKLRQLFLNLYTNAADAMPHGGTLTTRLFARPDPVGRPEVVIEVADTGSGIPADLLPRVMDPFFTTKEEGKGTGLGLAICRRIVHDHKGTIHIDSEVGKGTTVRIALPVAWGGGAGTP